LKTTFLHTLNCALNMTKHTHDFNRWNIKPRNFKQFVVTQLSVAIHQNFKQWIPIASEANVTNDTAKIFHTNSTWHKSHTVTVLCHRLTPDKSHLWNAQMHISLFPRLLTDIHQFLLRQELCEHTTLVTALQLSKYHKTTLMTIFQVYWSHQKLHRLLQPVALFWLLKQYLSQAWCHCWRSNKHQSSKLRWLMTKTEQYNFILNTAINPMG